MDPLIFASLSHNHYWYEVGMLEVPAASNVQRAIETNIHYINGSRRKVLVASIMEMELQVMYVKGRGAGYIY